MSWFQASVSTFNEDWSLGEGEKSEGGGEKVGECGSGRGKGNRPGPDHLEFRSMWINRGNRRKENLTAILKKVRWHTKFLFFLTISNNSNRRIKGGSKGE